MGLGTLLVFSLLMVALPLSTFSSAYQGRLDGLLQPLLGAELLEEHRVVVAGTLAVLGVSGPIVRRRRRRRRLLGQGTVASDRALLGSSCCLMTGADSAGRLYHRGVARAAPASTRHKPQVSVAPVWPRRQQQLAPGPVSRRWAAHGVLEQQWHS